MKKYEAPNMNIVKLEAEDIIQTSGLTDGGIASVPGTGTIVPTPGSVTSLDDAY